MRNSPVTRSAWDVVQKAIQELRRDVQLLKNSHSPTQPVYLPDVPDDQIDGQVALVPFDEVLDPTPTGVKPAWSFGDTWRPFGPYPSNSVSELITATGPAAFWKLDELTGTTAHDSSGNGHDMTPGIFGPPDWGATAGPTGLTSAYWPIAADHLVPERREDVGMTAFTNNFTAGVWFNALTDQGVDYLLGQGNPNNSWALAFIGGKIYGGKFTDPCIGSATLPYATWYFAAIVRDAGTWKLYVNGVLQADTSTAAPSSDTDTWLSVNSSGTSGGAGFSEDVRMSCAFITPTVMTGGDLLAIYDAGASGGSVSAAKVWTALGDGTADWRKPTIEVEF